MKKTMRIRCAINFWKYPIFRILVSCRGKCFEEAIFADAERILKYKCRRVDVFACLVCYKNFASVFIARCRTDILQWLIARVFFRQNTNIEILTNDIGKGLLVLHNMGAVIRAESIGNNVTISQGVTIGEGGGIDQKADSNIPRIGNNVLIASNALVLGHVIIGDNSIVGAGSVVTKDVDADTVVVGNPVRVLRCAK